MLVTVKPGNQVRLSIIMDLDYGIMRKLEIVNLSHDLLGNSLVGITQSVLVYAAVDTDSHMMCIYTPQGRAYID